MDYTFDGIFAVDPNQPSVVATESTVTIYAPGDVTKTPLVLKNVDGTPLQNPLTTNDHGFGPAFTAEQDRVAWDGGGFSGFFTSYEGMKNVAVAAQANAEASRIPGGGDTGQVLAKTSAADRDVQWVYPAGGGGGSNFVVVVTSPEQARPSAEIVFWVGGDTEPLNMANGDLWFAPVGSGGSSDITPPTAPMSLAFTGVAARSLTLGWTSSTDNVGVTGYEVTINGVVKASTSSTSASISGLAPETGYTATVRARDAAGNWSPASSPVSTTTTPDAAQQVYSIFGTNPHPGTLAKFTDNPLTLATAFYTYGASNGWRSVGMRIYVPLGVIVPATATCKLYTVDNVNLATDTAARTAPMTGITAGQWNTVMWTSPATVTPGQYFWCTYNFGNGDYLATPSTADGFIASVETSLFVEADGPPSGRARSQSLIDGAATQVGSGSHYGIDALIDKGA